MQQNAICIWTGGVSPALEQTPCVLQRLPEATRELQLDFKDHKCYLLTKRFPVLLLPLAKRREVAGPPLGKHSGPVEPASTQSVAARGPSSLPKLQGTVSLTRLSPVNGSLEVMQLREAQKPSSSEDLQPRCPLLRPPARTLLPGNSQFLARRPIQLQLQLLKKEELSGPKLNRHDLSCRLFHRLPVLLPRLQH